MEKQDPRQGSRRNNTDGLGRPDDFQRRLLTKIQEIPLVPDVVLQGRWVGYADTVINPGDTLYLPDERQWFASEKKTYRAHLEVDFLVRKENIRGAVRITVDLGMIGGAGEHIILGTLSGKSTGGNLISLHFQNVEVKNHFGHIDLNPSKDWKGLQGEFDFRGLFSRELESGSVFLQKVEEERTVDSGAPSNLFPLVGGKILGQKWGEDASDVIRDANHSIYASHFSKEKPPDNYLDILEEKLACNVRVMRIVFIHEDVPEDHYDWLKRFRQADGSLKPGYDEYIYQGKNIALDIVIVDEKKVLISLPAHQSPPHFTDTAIINDRATASSFYATFCQWREDSVPSEELGGDPAFLTFTPRIEG